MKSAILLLFAAIAFPSLAADMAPASAPASFKERVQLAKAAEDDENFHPYPAMMYRQAGEHLARTMRRCRAVSAKQDAKPFVLVADIHPDGRPHDVAVKPPHAAARCFATGFSSMQYLPPPAYPGRAGFPVMMRIGGGR